MTNQAQPTPAIVITAMAIGANLGQFNPQSASDVKRWVRTMFPGFDEEVAVGYGRLVSRMLEAHPDWVS